jgi:CubicO group peptidase (beta-lactamase class C family)
MDTGFRVASITKVFTSFMLFKLRDAGVVSIDDPLTKWLPSFGAVQARAWDLFPETTTRRNVTLGALAMHTSGLVREGPKGTGGGDTQEVEERMMAQMAKEPVRYGNVCTLHYACSY